MLGGPADAHGGDDGQMQFAKAEVQRSGDRPPASERAANHVCALTTRKGGLMARMSGRDEVNHDAARTVCWQQRLPCLFCRRPHAAWQSSAGHGMPARRSAIPSLSCTLHAASHAVCEPAGGRRAKQRHARERCEKRLRSLCARSREKSSSRPAEGRPLCGTQPANGHRSGAPRSRGLRPVASAAAAALTRCRASPSARAQPHTAALVSGCQHGQRRPSPTASSTSHRPPLQCHSARPTSLHLP